MNTNRTAAIIRQCYKFTLMVLTSQLTTIAEILKKILKYYKIEVKFTGLMIIRMRFWEDLPINLQSHLISVRIFLKISTHLFWINNRPYRFVKEEDLLGLLSCFSCNINIRTSFLPTLFPVLEHDEKSVFFLKELYFFLDSMIYFSTN